MRYFNAVRSSLCLLGLLALLVPSGLALATGSDGGFVQEVDGYRFQLVFAEHPKTGPNPIELKITGPGDTPVQGALIAAALEAAASEHEEAEQETHGEAVEAHSAAEMHAEEVAAGHDMPGMEAGEHAEEAGAGHGEAAQPEPEAGGHQESGGHGDNALVLLKPAEEAGHYRGTLSITAPGDWVVNLTVSLEGGGEKALAFPIDVIDAGPPWTVLSGFFTVNLVVVAAAGFLKRKSTAEQLNPAGSN
jgi:hypothetical protein